MFNGYTRQLHVSASTVHLQHSAQKLIITQQSPDVEISPSRARTLYYI